MNMITNLFSIFDPSMFLINVYPWIFSSLIILSFFHRKFWIKSKNIISLILLFIPLKKEISPLLGSFLKKGNFIILLFLFISIFLINFFALFPFIFTPTAHMMVTFPCAFILWLSFIIFGWINNTKNIMAHLVPIGTPFILINFIVLIEIVSNVIRPITLSVRLCANMVAGHLLLRLLRNFSLTRFNYFIYSFLGLIILGVLEIAVALIQGYVFITLISLYSTEIH